MKKVRKLFPKVILPVALAFAVPFSALAANASFSAPTSPMTVNKKVITMAAHSQAYESPEILGINNVTARKSEIPQLADETLSAAQVNPALTMFGSNINASPNPYLYNYFYDVYAAANGLTIVDDHVLTLPQTLSPAQADTQIVDAYGTSTSLHLRPDILLGISATSSNDGSNGYTSLIAALPENSDGDQTNNYNPYQLNYDMTTTYSFINGLKTMAGLCDQIMAGDSTRTTRYGEPMTIATNMEKYVKGIQAYVLYRLAQDNAQKKVAAIISDTANGDGTFNAYTVSTISGTAARTRAAEFMADTAVNLIDKLGIGTTGTSTYKVTADQIAQADVIITAGVTGGSAAETPEQVRTKLLASQDPSGSTYTKIMSTPILSASPTTVGLIGVNSIENAFGMDYWTAFVYPEYLNPIYVAAYYYQNFYHITDNTALQTAITANFMSASIPSNYGYTTDLSGYDPKTVENQIIKGMLYYTENTSAFTSTYLYTDGNNGGTGWNIDWQHGIGSNVTPTSTATVNNNTGNMGSTAITVTFDQSAGDTIRDSILATFSSEQLDYYNKGEQLSISENVTPISLSDLSADNAAKFSEALANGAQIGLYFNLDISYEFGGSTGTISQLSSPVSVTVTLPENLRGKASYIIYRLHDGSVTPIIPTVSADGTQLTFSTDKFSTYAIAYSDSIVNPSTGDGSATVYPVAAMIICALGITSLARRRRKSMTMPD